MCGALRTKFRAYQAIHWDMGLLTMRGFGKRRPSFLNICGRGGVGWDCREGLWAKGKPELASALLPYYLHVSHCGTIGWTVIDSPLLLSLQPSLRFNLFLLLTLPLWTMSQLPQYTPSVCSLPVLEPAPIGLKTLGTQPLARPFLAVPKSV